MANDKKQKRILIFYDNFCGPASHGGTEVASWRIANALSKYEDIEVYNAFYRHENEAGPDTYTGYIKLPRKKEGFVRELSRFIRENEIDYVVNMGRFFRQEKLSLSVKESGRDCGMLFMQHFAPGSEKKKTTFKAALQRLRLNPHKLRFWPRLLFLPLVKLPRRWGLKKMYREIYEKSDRIILLSEKYKEEYKKISKLDDTSKFAAIPNIYDCTPSEETVVKEKRVLILSRMDEVQKRISLALDIWKKIESNPALTGWHLDLVGTGGDIKGLQRRARKLGLKRVTFHGWKPNKPFLERSSILMMTSDYEGLPLSIIEAQSYGVVPIAFDSFASLGDMVKDGHNGVIVSTAGGIKEFEEKLAGLMTSDSDRERMAARAKVTAPTLFSSERISKMWRALFFENENPELKL